MVDVVEITVRPWSQKEARLFKLERDAAGGVTVAHILDALKRRPGKASVQRARTGDRGRDAPYTPRGRLDDRYEVLEVYATDAAGQPTGAALPWATVVRPNAMLVMRRMPAYTLLPDYVPMVSVTSHSSSDDKTTRL
jgi:hypothetical protein